MTTDDEAIANAIDPRLGMLETAKKSLHVQVRLSDCIAASDRIRALSARVAELDNFGATLLGQKINLILRAEAAEAGLREIALITENWPSPATLGDLADMLRRIAALAHTATQPEATPGKGEGL